MADKNFFTIGGVEAPAEAGADYEGASIFEKLRVGKLGVYFRDGLRLKFIPYGYMDRVFLRINEVNGKLCCGSTTFQYFRLVFVHSGKEVADYICENEQALRDALARIHELQPELAIGVAPKEG